MTVPSWRLIAGFGIAALLVFVATMALPAANLLAWLFPVALSLLAAFDWFTSKTALAQVRLGGPSPLRFFLDRAGAISVECHAPALANRPIRIGLSLPQGLEIEQEELQGTLPAPPAEGGRFTWTMTPRRRGKFTLDGMAIETDSSLGLWHLRRRLAAPIALSVYPNVQGAKDFSALQKVLNGSRRTRQLGKGREFEKLREYQPGDGYDEIHWKATARRGAPVTKSFQIERQQEVYCLLDSGRLSARKQEGKTVLDHGMTAALMLAMAAEHQGERFGGMVFSDRVHGFVRARNGKEHFSAIREMLYEQQPQLAATDFEEMTSYVRARLTRRSLIFIVTSLDEPALAEAFMRAARTLASRHVVVALCVHPEGAVPVFSGPELASREELFGALGGHLVWKELRELQLRLSRAGVRMASCEPVLLGSKMLEVYDEVRQRQLV